MSLLPMVVIRNVQKAVVTARLDREALLGGIDLTIRASLPMAQDLGSQLLQDLSVLNDLERLRDGTVPLARWLKNAIALAGVRVEGDVFREALAALGAKQDPPPKEPDSLQRRKDPPPPNTAPVKILFLGANPSDLTERALGREVREIGERLRAARMGDRFELAQAWAVRVSDLQESLLVHRPTIVHFSGHGSAEGELMVEDPQGRAFPVSPRGLAKMFEILRDNIRFVVLNAAASEEQAQAIAKHIDCVVRMTKAVADAPAISFAGALYRALGFGRSVQEAFSLGCNQLLLEGLAEANVPALICREGVRAEEIKLVSPR